MAIVQAMTRNAKQFGTCGVRKLDFCWKHGIHPEARLRQVPEVVDNDVP